MHISYIVLGYVAGGVVRGILVGIIVTIISLFFTHLHVVHPLITISVVNLAPKNDDTTLA